MIQDQIKKLATTLYGFENLEVNTVRQLIDNFPYRTGMWVAFVSRTKQECPNELLRDLYTGWGLTEENSLKNLRERLLKEVGNNIDNLKVEISKIEKTKEKLQILLEIEKEVREAL